MKKALMMASVASMIDLFNMDNIQILEDLGFEVEVACNFEKGSITSQERVDEFREELISNGYTIYHMPVPRSAFAIKDIVISYKMMKQLCDENSYNIVHCHSPIGGAIARLACRKARDQGTKVIYTAHGFHFYKGAPKKNWILYYPVEKFLSKYTDVLITINKEDYDRAKKFKAGKIEYMAGVGVDVEKFQNIHVEKEKKRKSIGVDKNDFILISVGELNKNKNQQVVINAIAQAKNEKIKYLICGLGPLENEIRELIKYFELENQVKIIGFRDDIAELLAIADLFALPSYREGLSLSLMEAMATGLPVICSDIRGNRDLIRDSENGYLLDPSDPLEWSDRINRLYLDKDLRKTFGQSSKNNISKYSKVNISDKVSKIYQGLIMNHSL